MLKNKKIVILLLCLVIVAQSAVALAVSFPDVKKDDKSGWAYDYIIELAEKGIIKGYDDGTYKPENSVTYLETLSLLHGVMNPSRTEINDSLAKYRTFLTNNNTPEWAMEIAAVALNRGVVQESEYTRANAAKMIEIGTKVSITRYDVAVFTARALELQPKSASTLTYKDLASINSSGAPLIAALIDTQVLHKDGRDGEFLPNSPIKRSEMAKMIKYAYDWTLTHPLKGPDAPTQTVTGTVVSYNPIGDKNFLVYRAANSTQPIAVLVNTSTKVTDKNNATVALRDIINYEGAGVTITYKTVGEEKQATEVKFTSDKAATDGQYTFKSYRTSGGKYYINVANTSGTTTQYESRYNTAKNGNGTLYLEDIKVDTKINLKFTSGIITDVTLVTPQTGEYEVTSVSTSYGNTKYIDTRKISGGATNSFTVDNSTVFVRDGKAAKYEDIGRGAVLDITTKSGSLASRIVIYSTGTATNTGDSYTFDRFEYGRIYLTNTRTGGTEPYYLSRNIRYYDGLTESGLRRGDKLKVNFSNNEVIEIRKDTDYGTTTGDYTFERFSGSRIYVTNNRNGRTENYYVPYSISSGISLIGGEQIDLSIRGDEVYNIVRRSSNIGSDERVRFTYKDGLFDYTEIYSNKDYYARLDRETGIKIYINGRSVSRNDLPYSGEARLTYDRYGGIVSIDVDRINSYAGVYDGVVDRVADSYVIVKLNDGSSKTYNGYLWELASYPVGTRVSLTLDSNGNATKIEKR